MTNEPEDDCETCIACDVPLKEGDLVHSEFQGGCIHAACCGPERESYYKDDGEPLDADDPIPEPWAWSARR